MSARSPATRRKADHLDTPGKRTRLITKQSPETPTEHALGAEQEEFQAFEDQGFVSETLLHVKSDVITRANEHGRSGLETLASLLSEQPK